MKKKYCIYANLLLLGWFFLDMVGVYFENTYLVTRSWKDDGIFMIIFVAALILLIFKEHIGKYILAGWQALWLITQFFSHVTSIEKSLAPGYEKADPRPMPNYEDVEEDYIVRGLVVENIAVA